MNSFIYLAFLLIGLQVKCHHPPGHNDDKDGHRHTNVPLHNQHESKYFHKIAPSNAKFALRVYKHIVSDAATKNVIFSPLSISIACAMLSLGPKSETLHQIYRGFAFNLPKIDEKEIYKGFHHLIHALNHPNNTEQVNLGNALFISESLKVLPNFLEDINALYDAEGFSTNIKDPAAAAAAAKLINSYVQNKTHRKIAHAVEDLDESTVMVLVNYIFLKATGREPQMTRKEDFFVNNETIVKVPMMSTLGLFRYYFDAEHSCKVVRMDYNSSATALFILPDEGKFKQIEDALSPDTITKWSEHTHCGTLNMHLPRFTISSTHELKEPLNRLGIDIFSDQTDLSGITGARDLKVSKVTHKAVLTVNEKGPETPPATMKYCRQSDHPIFMFNKPFLFALLEEKNLFFIGRITNVAEL